ncbi:CysS/YqeB C-terminal domain-containing protein [Corynebacterium propinquum]|uniref:CysS/YqeB C-terminal domain-containing protein n=1 Tax=Corynebacterium propinquum TaxID=43769 RepID=UPI0016425624|nr:hypothetical protein [Corynebacterium propinquum]MDK4257988.1 hypothetical protein [Corynebacterium propinquum]MDK4297987.1 hypothetical protein [Corynebacterium propinquum]MDK4319741.1 hypothetical protein [Corynebacterium propinquum]
MRWLPLSVLIRWMRSGQEVQGTGDSDVQQVLASLVEHELELRAAARKEKDFATADGVRDRLAAAGIEVIDTPNGAEWKLR